MNKLETLALGAIAITTMLFGMAVFINIAAAIHPVAAVVLTVAYGVPTVKLGLSLVRR